MITTDQIKDILQRVDNLKSYLDIDKKLIEISNEEEKASAPDFWNDSKEAERVMKILRGKKKWVEDYRQVKSDGEDLSVLFDFYKDDEASDAEVMAQYEKTMSLLESLEFKNMLSDEGDGLSAVLQITAGAGGTESCDWAQCL